MLDLKVNGINPGFKESYIFYFNENTKSIIFITKSIYNNNNNNNNKIFCKPN